MRIHRPTGPGAITLPGINDNRTEQKSIVIPLGSFGGIGEPLRIRAGWVPDETIKHLEAFVTTPATHSTAVLPFPTTPTDPNGSHRGGAA